MFWGLYWEFGLTVFLNLNDVFYISPLSNKPNLIFFVERNQITQNVNMNACKQGKVKTCRDKLLWIPKYVFSSPFCVFVAIPC